MKRPKLTSVIGRGGKGGNGADTPAAQAFYKQVTIDVLARTIWGEARGEGGKGMEAVACVILNRYKIALDRGGFWWGGDVIQICQKPQQFSCWNRADPNFQKLMAVDEMDLYFATARRIAMRALAGVLHDITGGATHYHASQIMPYWARGEDTTAIIGNHKFYKIV